MEHDISFLVGLKNNLEYSKFFYKNVRKLYPFVEVVFVSYGSTDGTNEWLDSLQDPFLKCYHHNESKTLSDTYNKATEISTKKFVCFLHNDMVVGEKFLDNLSENLSENDINFYKVIEPPIFTGDFRDWKLTKDFGDDIHTFDFQKFFDFENEYISGTNSSNTPTEHTSFFLCVKRSVLLEIGGLDNLFNPMFCEDDDLIIRLKLLGLRTVQLHTALVYHFVSKTSRFSDEYKSKTEAIEHKSQRNFIRKWGSKNNATIPVKYDVGIVLRKGNIDQLYQLEPLAKIVYVDFPYDDYIKNEQTQTKFDLKERIKPLTKIQNHDITIFVDGKAFNRKTLNSISDLSLLIRENQKSYLNPNIFIKSFLKIIKPYRPLMFFNKPERIEKSLIFKDMEI